jgi:hypothetical protein
MSGFREAMDDAMSAIQDAMGSVETSGDDAGDEASTGMQQAAEELANAQDIASQFFGNKDDSKSEEERSLSDDTQTAQTGAAHDFNAGLRGGMLDMTTAQHAADQYLGNKNKRQAAPPPGAPAQQSPFAGFKGFFDQIFGPKDQKPSKDDDKTEAQADKPEADAKPKDTKPEADAKPKDAKPEAEAKPMNAKPAAEAKPKNTKPEAEAKPMADKAGAEAKPTDDKVVADSKTQDGKAEAEDKTKNDKAESKTKNDKAESQDTKGDEAKHGKKPASESQDSKSAKDPATNAQDQGSPEAATLARRGVHFNKQKHQAAFNVARDLPEKRRGRPSGENGHRSSRTTYYKTKSANAFLSSAAAMETKETKDDQAWLHDITGKYGREVAEEQQASELDNANQKEAQLEKRRDQDADSYKEMTTSGAVSCWDDTIARILAAFFPVAIFVLVGLIWTIRSLPLLSSRCVKHLTNSRLIAHSNLKPIVYQASIALSLLPVTTIVLSFRYLV